MWCVLLYELAPCTPYNKPCSGRRPPTPPTPPPKKILSTSPPSHFPFHLKSSSYILHVFITSKALSLSVNTHLAVNGYVVVFSSNYQSFIVSSCSYFPTAYISSPWYTSKSECVVHTKAISLTPECVVYIKLSHFLMLYNILAHSPPPHSLTLDVWCTLSFVECSHLK